jgi:hypothetical protein
MVNVMGEKREEREGKRRKEKHPHTTIEHAEKCWGR